LAQGLLQSTEVGAALTRYNRRNHGQLKEEKEAFRIEEPWQGDYSGTLLNQPQHRNPRELAGERTMAEPAKKSRKLSGSKSLGTVATLGCGCVGLR